MTPKKKELYNYSAFKDPLKIKLADNSTLLAHGKGSTHIVVYNGTEKVRLILSDVLYVRKLQNKVLSLPTITEKGVTVHFKGQFCELMINDKRYRIGHKHGKLYKLTCELIEESCFGSNTDDANSLTLWHYRFGHLGFDTLKLMNEKSIVDGIKLNVKEEVSHDCEGCAKGKMQRTPFPRRSQHKSNEVLELVHSDVCGPMHVKSLGGLKYFLTFNDDFSRFASVYFLKTKSQVLETFKEFVASVKNQTEKRIKTLRSDNGGEYKSADFIRYCNSCGIKQEFTVPMTPEQNGVSERLNRTKMDTACSMLYHGHLPLSFWAEAVSTSVYLRNLSPSVSIDGMTPYERWYEHKPNVNHLRVFGCNAYVHVPDQKHKKLEEKSTTCIFVGYPITSKGYTFYNPESKKMFVSRDAKFLENSFVSNKVKATESSQDKEIFDFDSYFPEAEPVNEDSQEEIVPRRSQRIRSAPERPGTLTGDWWRNNRLYVTTNVNDVDFEPRSMDEALNSSNAFKWKAAADSEYESLLKNDTWKLVELPPGKNVVGCKWIFKLKRNADGSISRYKARLVTQGHTQEAGLEYDEVFAPVARYTSIRTVLAMSNALDLELHQMDVKTAFLNGELDNEIYMMQPDGYVDRQRADMVCKLQKSIYGLKQSARCWHLSIDQLLKASDYIQSDADPCIYSKSGESTIMSIALYVDDLLLASNDINLLENEKKAL